MNKRLGLPVVLSSTGKQNLEEEPVPAALRPPRISHEDTRDGTQGPRYEHSLSSS
jgi:hypothetical protein